MPLPNDQRARQRPPPEHGTRFATAIRLLSDPLAVKSVPYRARATWETRGSVPDFITFANAMLRECQRRSFPIVVSEAWRDGVRQDDLYRQGFSKARAGQSAHNHGMAGDFIHWKRGWDLSGEQWLILGQIGHECARKAKLRINWGGDDVLRESLWLPLDGKPRTIDGFRWDPAHFELADWKERLGR